jgi:hypothetical protein
MDELAKQAPYLFAIVVIVYAFLKAQALRDEMFLKAQSERDALFLKSIQGYADITAGIARDVQQNTQILISHDAAVRAGIRSLERAKKEKKG